MNHKIMQMSREGHEPLLVIEFENHREHNLPWRTVLDLGTLDGSCENAPSARNYFIQNHFEADFGDVQLVPFEPDRRLRGKV